MKILMLSDFETVAGGAEQYLRDLIKLLRENNHDVYAYFAEKKPTLRPVSSIFSIRQYKQVKKAIKKTNPDVVHIHKYNLALSLSALLAARSLGKKTVVTVHDFGQLCCNGWCVDRRGSPCADPASISWVFKQSLSRKPFVNKLYDYVKMKKHIFLLKLFANTLVAPSKALESYLYSLFPKKNILQIPYFVENTKIKKKQASNILLFIGRLEEEKGVEYLIEALGMLKNKYKAVIIGDGSQRKSLQKQAKKSNLNISFLGSQPHSEVKKWLKKADLLLVPSIWMEQLGIVGLEALSVGTPIIGSDIGGIPQWLHHKKNGMLVNPADPTKLAKAIQEFESYPQKEKIEMSKYGRKLFEKEFTKEVHYKRILKAYL